MDTFILVVSMWGFTGQEWAYIGQQSLQQEMSETQCIWLKSEEMWRSNYENENFRFRMDCMKASCAFQESCS